MGSVLAILLATRAPVPPPEAEVRRLIASQRPDLALAALQKALASGASLAPGRRRVLETLRARCLFELGDYPACEAQLRELVAAAPAGSEEHMACLAHLARALSFQDAHDEAMDVLDGALRLREAPGLHRLAIALLLRARRYREILPHAAALLAADPEEPFAHFARGIALSREGRFPEALRELTRGLALPGAKRDAHFEVALVLARLKRPREALGHLLEILVDAPYDQEACYQASRQLIAIRTPAAMETAGNLVLYFEVIKKAHGASSRDHHLEAAGRPSLAAVLRAARWERLGAYDRAISEIRRAQALAREETTPFLHAADFWGRMGLLAEAKATLDRLEARPASSRQEIAGRIRKLRALLAEQRERLRAGAGTPLGRARLDLATASWADARPLLEALLDRAVAAGRPSLAQRAARLLLAREPRSVRALAFLVDRTSDPSLLVPRLHFLARLVEARPGDRRRREELRRARRTFLGEEASRPPREGPGRP